MTPALPLEIQMDELTPDELAAINHALGAQLGEVMAGLDQPLAVAAIGWVWGQREDPDWTFEEARKLPTKNFKVVNPDPEVRSDGNGALPAPSLASGT